jgi:hypothetical protein
MDIIFNATNILIEAEEYRVWFLRPWPHSFATTVATSFRLLGRSTISTSIICFVGYWFKATGEDPTNKRFGKDWAGFCCSIAREV